jgi:glycerol uptake facilitator-like aquaporin
MPSLAQRVFAEGLGTAFLLAAVVGSGIMAQRLADGNDALALLCNTIPTGAILAVLILTFGEISGAHFNPAVTIAFALRRELAWPTGAAYTPKPRKPLPTPELPRVSVRKRSVFQAPDRSALARIVAR